MKKMNTFLALLALTMSLTSSTSAMSAMWRTKSPRYASTPSISRSVGTGLTTALSFPSQNLVSAANVATKTMSVNDLKTKSIGANELFTNNMRDVNLQGAPTVSGGLSVPSAGTANSGALTFDNNTMASLGGGAVDVTGAGVGTIGALTSDAPLAVKTGALIGASDSFISNSSSTVNNQSTAVSPTSFASATLGVPVGTSTMPFSQISDTHKMPQNINVISTQDVTSESIADNNARTVGAARATGATENILKLLAQGNTGAITSTNNVFKTAGAVEAGNVTGATNITAQNIQQNTNSANSTAITPAPTPTTITVSSNASSGETTA